MGEGVGQKQLRSNRFSTDWRRWEANECPQIGAKLNIKLLDPTAEGLLRAPGQAVPYGRGLYLTILQDPSLLFP